VDAFREALDEKLDLARYLYEELSTIPELELPWEPELTVVPFRLRHGPNDADRGLLDLINASKRVVLSSTVVEHRFTIRACILSHRTHRDRIEECVQIVRRAVADVTGR
jgi:aromatic-L-amino-acid decarboxylase